MTHPNYARMPGPGDFPTATEVEVPDELQEAITHAITCSTIPDLPGIFNSDVNDIIDFIWERAAKNIERQDRERD